MPTVLPESSTAWRQISFLAQRPSTMLLCALTIRRPAASISARANSATGTALPPVVRAT